MFEMQTRHKTGFLICVALSFFSLFLCKAKELPKPSSPPDTDNPVELLDFVSREVAKIIQPGIATEQIEQYVNKMLKPTKAVLYFKGYRGYPSIITLSVNNEVISAPPSSRVLKEGDLLKMEFGLALNSKHAVAEWTFPVGKISEGDQRLLRGTYEAMEAGIKEIRDGASVSTVSKAIEEKLLAAGLQPNRDFVGYQIGVRPHMNPPIPAFYDPSSSIWAKDNQLSAGMTLAVIVVAHQGDAACYVDRDGWTVKTKGGTKGACFSRMVEVTEDEAKVLTTEPHFSTP